MNNDSEARFGHVSINLLDPAAASLASVIVSSLLQSVFPASEVEVCFVGVSVETIELVTCD